MEFTEAWEIREDWDAQINYEAVLQDLLELIRRYAYNISPIDVGLCLCCFHVLEINTVCMSYMCLSA